LIPARFFSLLYFPLLFFYITIIIGEEKSSDDIQKDIDSRKSKLQSLRNEIKDVEERLLLKNKEAINTTEILLDLESKIALTEKLIRSLNKEEQFISELINKTEKQIQKKENLLIKLKKQLTQRLQYLYIHGRPSVLETILHANDWNKAIYRIKYLDVLAEHEKILRKKMQQTMKIMADEKANLMEELNLKTRLLNEKKQEGKNLEEDKKERKILLSKIKKDKGKLEKTRIQKTRMIAEMEVLIKKLYADKESMKKREEELARIRAEQNRSTTGNFAKMKSRLNWPVEGQIVGQFGTIRNPDTGVLTENVGVDIRAKNGSPVKSVLDGVVSTITYIRGHGNIIIIDHGGGFSTVYAQIDHITVHENDYVQMGNTIAFVAIQEDNSVSRLHFEVWGNQKKQNPEHWLIRK